MCKIGKQILKFKIFNNQTPKGPPSPSLITINKCHTRNVHSQLTLINHGQKLSQIFNIGLSTRYKMDLKKHTFSIFLTIILPEVHHHLPISQFTSVTLDRVLLNQLFPTMDEHLHEFSTSNRPRRVKQTNKHRNSKISTVGLPEVHHHL